MDDNFSYEYSEIPQSLINECESQAINNKEVMFIFDGKITTTGVSNVSTREDKLDFIIGEYDDELEQYKETYHIGDESYFKYLPSRFSYYDTETKEVNRYKKYKKVIEFVEGLDFTPSQHNFGPEYEQSFFGTIGNGNFIVRIKPNLFINILESNKSIYNEFFKRDCIIDSISKILNIDSKSLYRDLKIKEIL